MLLRKYLITKHVKNLIFNSKEIDPQLKNLAKELRTLYKRGTGARNMTPLLKTTGLWVWSGETRGSSSAWGFGFSIGYEYWENRDASRGARAFAFRFRK